MTRKIIPSILLAAAFLFTLLSSPIIADVLTEAQVAGKDVLFVVGVEERSGPSDDGLIREYLEAMGLNVTMGRDTDSADTAKGQDLILISSTTNARVLGAKYRNSTTPVMTWNAYTYGDLLMTGSHIHKDFSVVRESVQHQENHANFYAWGTNEAHELSRAAGLQAGMFLPIFFDGETDMNWGRPGLGADTLVTFKGDRHQAGLFVYEQGATMTRDFNAPARRVGIFLGDDTFHQLSEAQGPAAADPKEFAWFAGKRVFQASIRWALSSPPEVEKKPAAIKRQLTKAADGKKVLFVRSLNLPWPAGESSVPKNVAHLESLGFDVTVRDHMESDEVAGDFDLVIITAAINKFKFSNKYTDAPVPVLLMETKNVDAMKLAGPGRTIEYGTNDHKDSLFPPENYVNIIRANHDLAGSFSSGLVQIYDAPGVMGWCEPAPSAIVIATVPNQPDHAAIFGYEKGSTMAFSFVAPARRAVFPLDFPMFARLTPEGLALYESVLFWLVSGS